MAQDKDPPASDPNNRVLAEEIAHAVRARLGKREPSTERLVAEELAALLGPPAVTPSPHPTRPAGDPMAADDEAVAPLTDRIVISANGRNRGGIVAGLTAVISEMGGDIRDISQTMVGDYFTMIFVVDVAGATQRGRRFAELKERLEQAGKRLGTHVVALHDDLLTAMHSV